MKTRITKEGANALLILPPAAAEAMKESQEAQVLVLKQGALLVCSPGAFEKMQKEEMPCEGKIMLKKAQAPEAGKNDEQMLLHKLSLIRFAERTVPALEKALSQNEKKLLQNLVERKIISIFKNEKYQKGVYNIPQGVYAAASKPVQEKAQAAPFAPENSHSGQLNSVDHLVARGYMVLNNENEAKMVMPQIALKLKNETVKGVRGFDRRYYVLRRSFLLEYESRLLPLLEQKSQSAYELAGKLGLDEEAVLVLLMILGDEGEAIEKKKGMWGRA